MSNLKVLPKNITQRKDGRYVYRYVVDGKTKAIYDWNLDKLIAIKESRENSSIEDLYSQEIVQKALMKNLSRSEETISSVMPEKQYVYFVSDGEFVKIGVSKDVAFRLKKMQTSSPRVLKLLWCIETHAPYLIETALHTVLKSRRINGEWFDILDLFNESEVDYGKRSCSC